MKGRPYYTVIVQRKGQGLWHPSYGSFDKSDCRDEIACASDNASLLTSFKIITSGHTQSDIMECINNLNRGIKQCEI